MTVITPGAGCSITSTATVSIAGATDGFTFRAAFFTGAGLGLALATVRFVAFATLDALRVLPRLAELRSFARFCTFDAFLRLAMIDPLVLRNDTTVQVAPAIKTRVITRFQLERDRLGAILPRSNCASENADEVNTAARCFTGRFDRPTDAVQEHGTMGTKAKSSGVGGRRRLCCLWAAAAGTLTADMAALHSARDRGVETIRHIVS